MGVDGHFASIFQNLKKFARIIDSKEKPNIFLTEKIGKPFCERFTMNMSMILLSTKIIIVLKDVKRINLFLKFINDKNEMTPINHLVNKSKNKILINFNNDLLSLNKFKKKYA